jgi:uncharacterized protein (DUF1697 family)
MIYVALLRGINVGGANKVDMATLRSAVAEIGADRVRTYINSGNVVFDHPRVRAHDLALTVENVVDQAFGLQIPTLVHPGHRIEAIAEAIPAGWTQDDANRCDVMYLWSDIDDPGLLDEVPINPAVEEAIYTPGALIWRVGRDDLTRSHRNRLIGTRVYSRMTVRNANTARKLADLVDTART